jgi:hypothetical protein
MNRASRYPFFFTACKSALLTVALIAVVGACGKRQHRPNPPSAVPRPVTRFIAGGYLTTADLRLHAPLKTVPAGWM